MVYKSDGGWEILDKTVADSPKEAVVHEVIEFRGYDFEDEEKVFQFVTELYEAMDELSEDK